MLSEIKDQSQQRSKFPSSESVLADMGLDSATVKSIKPRVKRAQYRAVINWLTQYKPEDDSVIAQLRCYIEALYHLCEVQTWKRIKILLAIPIKINPPTVNSSMPLDDYLIFQGLYRELLNSSRAIIKSLENTSSDISSIILLKGKGLFGTGQLAAACQVFEEVRVNSPEGSETYIEAFARLGITNIQAGRYQEGLLTLDKAFIMIDKFIKNHPFLDFPKLEDLKTEIMGERAYYELNAGHYKTAMRLYTEIVDILKKKGQVHKLVILLIYQGIVLRRLNKYGSSINYLTEALEIAKNINKENEKIWINHHLAYALLNQGKLSLAEESCQVSLEGYRIREDNRGISDCYEQMGLINLAKGEVGKAERNFAKSLTIRQSIGNIHGSASSVKNLAFAAWHQRHYFKFAKLLLQSFKMYYQIGVFNRARLFKMLKLVYVWTVGKRNWIS